MSCSSRVCEFGLSNILLACEDGEKIESISSIQFGSEISNCSSSSSSHAACHVDVARTLIENACIDENRCEFNSIDVIQTACGNAIPAIQLGVGINCHGESGGVDLLTFVVLVLYCCISLGLGTTLTAQLFKDIWTHKRRAFLIGWCSQFGFMPLMAFALAHMFQLDSLVAVGVVLVGCAPGGSTSNLMTYWVEGNVALSIAMSCASTLCALFMIPILFMVYIQSGFARDSNLTLPITSVLVTLLTILVPVLCGISIRRASKEWRCGPPGCKLLFYQWIEKGGSLIGAIFLAVALVVGIRANPDVMNPASYPKEWVIASAFQPLGCLFGYTMAKFSRLDGADCRAICLETGVQSYPMILAITSLSFSGCTRTKINTFVYISAVWYFISSAWLLILLRFILLPRDPDRGTEADVKAPDV